MEKTLAPRQIRSGLEGMIKIKKRELDSLHKAYEAISSVDSTPADGPRHTTEDDAGKKIDGRRNNGGNSTKAKDPAKDKRRFNGRKKGTKTAGRRKRATVTA